MSGIIFFKTRILEEIVDFYIKEIGCQKWLDQKDCSILRSDNLLLGFCQRDECDLNGIITFFFKTRQEVDWIYVQLKSIADSPPKENEKYQIYNFFARDPEGRLVEFQSFNHPIDI